MAPVSLGSKDPALDINKYLVDQGGQPLNLDGMDPQKLASIRDGLKQFLDNFDQAKAQDPQLAQVADSQAVQSLRQLAQIASVKAAQAGIPPSVQGQAPNARVRGMAFANNGSNFDPMSMNQVPSAAILQSALGTGQAGVLSNNALTALLGAGAGAAGALGLQ
ncbi:MAG TPA: hypothetical protein VGO62_05820, partial [Myxococcota bacterium]